MSTRQENEGEFMAYYNALVTAHNTSTGAFAQSARREVNQAQLYEEPDNLRGEVVHIEGNLVRVRRFDPASMFLSQGVTTVYEGWIFNPDDLFAKPFCVVFTDLPPGVQVAERLDPEVAVKFDGYFFKIYGYQVGDRWKYAPLVIGRMPVVVKETTRAAPPAKGFSTLFIVTALSLAGAVILFVCGLTLIYRRGDRRVRARLAASKSTEFGEPGAFETGNTEREEERN